jgi:type II restriction/modification system DNA methylase subunit YeeA
VPVLIVPLRREWEGVKQQAEKLWEKIQAEAGKDRKRRTDSRARQQFDRLITDFAERLAHVTVLDPACGSGNFLYVAIHLLLDLEKEVLSYGSERGIARIPLVRPTQLAGLEINGYAQQLAQIVIWIGYLQWKFFNGYQAPLDPVLDPFENIRHTDAILDLSDPANPQEPAWPEVEFVVGNPPFLGGKKMRTELGDDYVDRLFRVWEGRVKAEADLCCYWFEKARATIEAGKVKRAGLLATQGIRGGANRETLKRLKQTGNIFFAESDRDWILDGATVHVSMIGFDDGSEADRRLDGKPVAQIHSDLSSGIDVTVARRLAANRDTAFMGDTKGGAFDISEGLALEMLRQPNPNGRPNSDVVVPWINGLDVTRRDRRMWIIDYGTNCPAGQAALYEAPFEFVRQHVHPARQTNKREAYRDRWWLHVEARSGMRKAFAALSRFIAIPRVAKHRLFIWAQSPTLPDCQLITFAFEDDFCFGVLHSRAHEVWARANGTQVRERESGFRYTPTSCFETFPFPEPTEAQREAIAAAARTLDERRNNWLNPPEWTREETLTFPGSLDGPWRRLVSDADARGIGTVHYCRRVPKDDKAAKDLTKRTLTNLYNQAPAWLKQAHQQLDDAVFAAYGWPAGLGDEEILSRLLDLNLQRDAASGDGQAPAPSAEENEADEA